MRGWLVAAALLFSAGCAAPPPADDRIAARPGGVTETAVAIELPPSQRREPPELPAGPLELRVYEAVVMALERNRGLDVQRLGPAITRTFEVEERAAFDPTLEGDADAARSRGPTGPRTTSYGFRMGVSEFLPTGTLVTGDLTTDRRYPSGPGTEWGSRAGLTITQALLQGAGLDVNLASVRQARLDTLASEFELRGFVEALAAQVETNALDHVLAVRRLEIVGDSLAIAERQLEETLERIRVGRTAESEMAAAESEVARRRANLIDARSAVELAQIALARLLDPTGPRPFDRPITVIDVPTAPAVVLDDVEDHVRIALARRPDLNQAKLQVLQGDLQLVQTRNGLLPRMDLFVTLGKTGFADSFRRSVDDVDEESYDAAAGLSFRFPIGNRAAEARHERAQLSRRQAFEAVENLAQLVETDVRAAFVELRRTLEQVPATAAARRASEEVVRAETEKFRIGRSTAILVAQAQRDLATARIGEVEAAIGVLKALVDVHRLEGSLLLRRGIDAPGQRTVELPSGS